MSKAFFVALAGAVAAAAPAFAQSFEAIDRVPAHIQALPAFVRPEIGRTFRLDWESFDHDRGAPRVVVGEDAPPNEQSKIMLPSPTGQLNQYRIVESSIMEPGLAAKFPAFKAYRVFGVDDEAAVGRLDVTSQGLRGMIRTSRGTVFIDPYSAQQREFVSVYYLHDFTGSSHDWTCHVGKEHGADMPFDQPEEQSGAAPSTRANIPLRSYRMAMACSGEYGAYQSFVQGHAPNSTDALAAIVTVVNRCNVTYEVDIGVRFLLVANNNLLAFFDPATDPYPDADPTCTSNPAADCSGGYLNVNTPALNSIIGQSNYDVGHVLTRVRGGVAYLSSVCGGNKAGGVSGIPRGGEIEPASALVPMHELGHQFGANHTFNGVLGRCNANINGTTNYEPGGGSTLMAYPGACPVGGTIGEGDTDNLVLFADPYFHTGSLIEIRGFLASGSSNCFQTVATSNTGAPVINSTSTSNLFIPPSTPFELSVNASDDSPTLSYSWDELDVGPAQRLTGPTSADNGSSALFRSFLPTPNNARSFPRLSDLIAGTSYIGERVPTFANATRKFRVTVRDNQGASTTSNLVNVKIASTQPFVVAEPAANQTVHGPLISVRWNADAIAAPPISTESVLLSLSLDNGLTYPFVLASTVPNTGQAFMPASGQTSSQARVRVAAFGNNFFNISAPFQLTLPCPADFNHDGFVTGDDFDGYVDAFQSGMPAADFNNDGFVTGDDFDLFVDAFEIGC